MWQDEIFILVVADWNQLKINGICFNFRPKTVSPNLLAHRLEQERDLGYHPVAHQRVGFADPQSGHRFDTHGAIVGFWCCRRRWEAQKWKSSIAKGHGAFVCHTWSSFLPFGTHRHLCSHSAVVEGGCHVRPSQQNCCPLPFATCSCTFYTFESKVRKNIEKWPNSLSHALKEVAWKLLPLVLRFVTLNVWSWTKRIACWTWALNHRFARSTKSCLKQPRPQGIRRCMRMAGIRDHLQLFHALKGFQRGKWHRESDKCMKVLLICDLVTLLCVFKSKAYESSSPDFQTWGRVRSFHFVSSMWNHVILPGRGKWRRDIADHVGLGYTGTGCKGAAWYVKQKQTQALWISQFAWSEQHSCETKRSEPFQSSIASTAAAVCNPRLAEFCLRPKAFWADADADAATAEQDGAGTVSLGQELNFAAPSTLTQWHLDWKWWRVVRHAGKCCARFL